MLPYTHHCYFPSQSPPFKLACLVARNMCIMGHTPLSMHEGHVRPIFPDSMCPYQSYGTWLQWISAAISASLPFSITEPPVQASLACCMERMNYESHLIEYAFRSWQTWFSCSCVSIPMIWNTVAMNKCCHIYITPIFHHGAPYSS